MALTQNNLVDWTDIETIFTNLSAARKKFLGNSYAVTAPANEGKNVQTRTVSDLKSLIEDMRSSAYIGNTANTGVTVPSVGDLLKTNPFDTFRSKISTISSVRAFDSSDYDSCFSYGFDASFFSTHRSSFNASHRDNDAFYSFTRNYGFHYNGFTWNGRTAF